MSVERRHWVSDAPTSLHGNGAASFELTTRNPGDVTCKLCITELRRLEDELCVDADVCDAHADEYGQYPRTCLGCGFQWRSNHCIHDGVQNPCQRCGWKLGGTRTPLEFLGFERP